MVKKHKNINDLWWRTPAIAVEKVEKTTKWPKQELVQNLNMLTPIDVIEHIKDKILPIESGKVRYFNPIKREWFIKPNEWGKDIYITDVKRSLKDWEDVNYIQINHEALVTSKGTIKIKSWTDGDIGYKLLIIQQDSWEKDVVLHLKAQHISGQRYWYILDVKDFHQWDEVEYIANKKGDVVAIKKVG